MYVLDRERQDQILRLLTPHSVVDDGWGQRFVDPATGEEWKLYYPSSHQHGGGPRVLRKEPAPIDDVELALRGVASADEDDTTGAAYDLSGRPEAWEAIISMLERKRASLSRKRVEKFVTLLGVLNPVNRRPVLGKTLADIETDAAYFRDLSERATDLIND